MKRTVLMRLLSLVLALVMLGAAAAVPVYAESGKCGCPECYNTFNSELLPYLKRVHGSIQHIGKIPNRAPLTVAVDTETAEGLRSKLNQLIREEKYEEAAIIRDKIKRLEGESK